MNALVIGGTGFIGRRLVKNLLENGIEVTIATRGKSSNPFTGKVKEVVVDRFSESSLEKALPEGAYYDVVYDQVGFGPEDLAITLPALKGKAGLYVYTSSLAVYPEAGTDMKEDDFDPSRHAMQEGGIGNLGYAEGKRSAEAYLQKNATFPYAAIRFPVVVGPDDVTGRVQFHVERIAQGKPIVIPWKRGRMNYIWVEDAGRFLAWIGINGKTGPYNPASPERIDAASMVEKLAFGMGGKAVIEEEGNDDDRSPYYRPEDWSMSTEKAVSEGFRFTPLDQWVPEVAREAVETGGEKKNTMDYMAEKLQKK